MFIDIYELLDLRATHSFVNPYIASYFVVSSKILLESFMISTLVRDSVIAKTVYRNYPNIDS